MLQRLLKNIRFDLKNNWIEILIFPAILFLAFSFFSRKPASEWPPLDPDEIVMIKLKRPANDDSGAGIFIENHLTREQIELLATRWNQQALQTQGRAFAGQSPDYIQITYKDGHRNFFNCSHGRVTDAPSKRTFLDLGADFQQQLWDHSIRVYPPPKS